MPPSDWLIRLIPVYEAAALDLRCLGYLWLTWPEIVARSVMPRE